MAATEAATKRLSDIYSFGKSTFASFFSDLKTGLMDGTMGWDDLGDAAVKALDKIADRALGMVADGIFDLLFGAVMSGITGGLSGGVGAGGRLGLGLTGPNVYGGSGGMFGLPKFAEGGWTGNSIGMVDPHEFVVRRGPASQYRPMLEAMNNGAALGRSGGSTISVEASMQVINGNLVPVITSVSGTVAGQRIAQAAPTIVSAANESAPSAVAYHQSQRGGSDYRV